MLFGGQTVCDNDLAFTSIKGTIDFFVDLIAILQIIR